MAFLRVERVCPIARSVPSAAIAGVAQAQGVPATVFPQNLIKTGRTAPLMTRCARNKAPCGAMLPAGDFVPVHGAFTINQHAARLV